MTFPTSLIIIYTQELNNLLLDTLENFSQNSLWGGFWENAPTTKHTLPNNRLQQTQSQRAASFFRIGPGLENFLRITTSSTVQLSKIIFNYEFTSKCLRNPLFASPGRRLRSPPLVEWQTCPCSTLYDAGLDASICSTRRRRLLRGTSRAVIMSRR